MTIKQMLKLPVEHPEGLEISSFLINFFESGKIVTKKIDDIFTAKAYISGRHAALQIIINSLVFYPAIFGILITFLSMFASMLKVSLLIDIFTIIVMLTTVPLIGIAMYLVLKTFSNQIKYKALIKKGLGHTKIGDSSYTLYNKDYMLGLFLIGLPLSIISLITFFIFK